MYGVQSKYLYMRTKYAFFVLIPIISYQGHFRKCHSIAHYDYVSYFLSKPLQKSSRQKVVVSCYHPNQARYRISSALNIV